VDEISPGSGTAGQFIKVIFELPQDDDGWPPAGSEGLWAVPVTSDVARLDNTPFFVRGVATGDLIRVRRNDDGQLQADERLQWSGHCTSALENDEGTSDWCPSESRKGSRVPGMRATRFHASSHPELQSHAVAVGWRLHRRSAHRGHAGQIDEQSQTVQPVIAPIDAARWPQELDSSANRQRSVGPRHRRAPGELPSTAVGLFLARQFQRDSSARILAMGWLRHLGLDGSCRTSRHLRAEALYPSQDPGRRIHAWQLGEVTHTPTI
jgi:Domain of unknown function (DUF4265)